MESQFDLNDWDESFKYLLTCFSLDSRWNWQCPKDAQAKLKKKKKKHIKNTDMVTVNNLKTYFGFLNTETASKAFIMGSIEHKSQNPELVKLITQHDFKNKKQLKVK